MLQIITFVLFKWNAACKWKCSIGVQYLSSILSSVRIIYLVYSVVECKPRIFVPNLKTKNMGSACTWVRLLAVMLKMNTLLTLACVAMMEGCWCWRMWQRWKAADASFILCVSCNTLYTQSLSVLYTWKCGLIHFSFVHWCRPTLRDWNRMCTNILVLLLIICINWSCFQCFNITVCYEATMSKVNWN